MADAATDPVVIECRKSCDAGDSDSELACLECIQEECQDTIGISRVINDQKADIDGVDLVIEDNTLPRTESVAAIDFD